MSDMLKTKQRWNLRWTPHLDEGNLAGAHVALEVVDGDLSIMLQVSLLAQDVMDAGHYFVPLIVVPIPADVRN